MTRREPPPAESPPGDPPLDWEAPCAQPACEASPRPRRVPSASSILLVAIGAVHLLPFLIGRAPWGEVLVPGTSLRSLWPELGSTLGRETFAEPWRLLTAGFLHWGLFHLLANGFGLGAVTPLLERCTGRRRALAVHLLASTGGMAASSALHDSAVFAAGSSNGIFGSLAATVVVLTRRRLHGGAGDLGLILVLGSSLLLLLLGLPWVLPSVDGIGHAGGALTGAVVGLFSMRPHRRRAAEVCLGLLVAAGLLVGAGLPMWRAVELDVERGPAADDWVDLPELGVRLPVPRTWSRVPTRTGVRWKALGQRVAEAGLSAPRGARPGTPLTRLYAFEEELRRSVRSGPGELHGQQRIYLDDLVGEPPGGIIAGFLLTYSDFLGEVNRTLHVRLLDSPQGAVRVEIFAGTLPRDRELALRILQSIELLR